MSSAYKPMTYDLAQAEALAKIVDSSKAVFCFVYSQLHRLPLVRQAREMILNGELGEIQAVRSSYIQGWLRTRWKHPTKTSRWRPIRPRAVLPAVFGDIATHAYNLGRYMTDFWPTRFLVI